MAIQTRPIIPEPPHTVRPALLLRDGDRLSAEEFERRYRASPELKKAELIEGIVHVTSPVSDVHGPAHLDLAFWIGLYRASTPGVIGSVEGTIRLDAKNLPQPDLHLRLPPELGGRARVGDDRLVEGAPELVAEIAVSSAEHDLTRKLDLYARNGIREYLVWRVEDAVVDWFVLREGRYERLAPNAYGHHESEIFPGLRLAADALARGDLASVFAVARLGLESPEHAAFVEQLKPANETG